MSSKQTNVETRLNELEATVRGLTQELVDANERIRHLEAEFEDGQANESTGESRVLSSEQRNESSGTDERGECSSGGSKKGMGTDSKADEETASGLDDIIVA